MGCISQTELTSEQIKQNTIQKFETAKNYTYTMNITSHADEGSYVISEITYKQPNKEKLTLQRYPEKTGLITTNNGTTIWIYNSEDNTAVKNPAALTSLLELNPLYYKSFIQLIKNNSPEKLGSENLNKKRAYIM